MQSSAAAPSCEQPGDAQNMASAQFRAAVQVKLDSLLEDVMVQFESHFSSTGDAPTNNLPSTIITSCSSANDASLSCGPLPTLQGDEAPAEWSDYDFEAEKLDGVQLDFGYDAEHDVDTATQHKSGSAFPYTHSVSTRLQQELFDKIHAHHFDELIAHRWQYDVFIGILIVVNAFFLGWQLDYRTKHGESSPIEQYSTATFAILFLLDVLVRFYESRLDFFFGIDKYWNAFDAFVVGTMLVEQFMRLLSLGDSSSLSTLSALRVLRLLRLLRILRILKVLTFFKEFRLMCSAIMSGSTWRILFWVIILLGVFFYIAALALTQFALDHCITDTLNSQLCADFGSLSDTLFTLYKVMYGGAVWGQHAEELELLGPLPVISLCGFVLLSVTLVHNGITGVVIRDINQCADMVQDWRITDDEARQALLVQELSDLFNQIDVDGSRCMSFYELDTALKDPQISKVFDSLKLQPHDMQELFYLLDVDNTGEVEIEAFIIECVRLRNDARAMDVWQLQNETKRIASTLQGISKVLEENFSNQPASTSSREPQEIVSLPSSQRQPAITRAMSPGLRAISGQKMLQAVRDKGHSGEPIKRTEMRSMSLKDLRGVCTWIRSQCLLEKWRDQRTGHEIQPAEVNLYHLNHHVICPLAAPDGIMMQGLQDGTFKKGQRVSQRRPADALPVATGVVKADCNGSCLEVHVTRGRFGLSAGLVEVDGRACGVPSFVDVFVSLSYKEIISSKPLQPLWFVSHYWGSPIFDFVACCEHHAKSWGFPESTASYWVCGYANRQWALEMEIGNDLDNCSFHMAMQLAMGTLLILDKMATPFERIWCDFEISKTLLHPNMLLDMVTMVGDNGSKREPVLLSSGNPPHLSTHAKTAREERFPLSLAVRGMLAKLEQGKSSVPADKSNILSHLRSITLDKNKMQEVINSHHDVQMLDSHAMEEVNNSLHAYLALCVWPQAVRRGNVLDLDETHPGALSLPAVLKKDTARTSLSLDLSHSSNLNDEGVAAVADGLPPNLLKLDLNFTGCSSVSDQGVQHLAANLPARLESLKINFTGCEHVTDAGLVFLAGCLGHLAHLCQLRLSFAGCHKIDVHGLHALAHGTPRSVTDFSAVLLGTGVNTNIKSAKLLERVRRSV